MKAMASQISCAGHVVMSSCGMELMKIVQFARSAGQGGPTSKASQKPWALLQLSRLCLTEGAIYCVEKSLGGKRLVKIGNTAESEGLGSQHVIIMCSHEDNGRFIAKFGQLPAQFHSSGGAKVNVDNQAIGFACGSCIQKFICRGI